jgi:hypothetical protein
MAERVEDVSINMYRKERDRLQTITFFILGSAEE